MERFGHRAESLAQARCLSAREAECARDRWCIESEQPARRRSRAERPDCSRHVPDRAVAHRLHRARYPARDFEAERARGKEMPAARVSVLGEGERRRYRRGRRVEDRREIRVVEIVEMREKAVRERGVLKRRPEAEAEHRSLRMSAFVLEEIEQDARRGILRRVQCDTERVEDAALGVMKNFGRNLICAGGADELREIESG